MARATAAGPSLSFLPATNGLRNNPQIFPSGKACATSHDHGTRGQQSNTSSTQLQILSKGLMFTSQRP